MGKLLGKRLKRARLSEGLSQTELAKKLGPSVYQSTVSTWEVGTAEPKPAHMKKLELVLGKLKESKRRTRQSEEPQGPSGAFGAWLRKARSDAAMSVPELARAASVSPMAIYNIEAGKSLNPQAETRKRLATALKTEVPDDVEEESQEEQDIEGLGPLTDFDPHDRKGRPSASGVYVFYDVSDRPVYIGESQNIGTRVGTHEDKFWFKFPIVSNAAYVEIKDKELRHQVEQVLIKFLKSNAVINKQSVDR